MISNNFSIAFILNFSFIDEKFLFLLTKKEKSLCFEEYSFEENNIISRDTILEDTNFFDLNRLVLKSGKFNSRNTSPFSLVLALNVSFYGKLYIILFIII